MPFWIKWSYNILFFVEKSLLTVFATFARCTACVWLVTAVNSHRFSPSNGCLKSCIWNKDINSVLWSSSVFKHTTAQGFNISTGVTYAIKQDSNYLVSSLPTIAFKFATYIGSALVIWCLSIWIKEYFLDLSLNFQIWLKTIYSATHIP